MRIANHIDLRYFFNGLCLLGLLFAFQATMIAQEKNEQRLEEQRLAQGYLSDAGDALEDDDFVNAEANYRKAIALDPSLETGKYNLGNAYYNKTKNGEAMNRYKQAATTAKTKEERHRAFHNLGNTFMNAKQYQEAVESYKSALRNDPTDDETRYNLALAKEMLEKNPPQGGDGEDENQDQNQDQEQPQDNENQDNEGQEQEGEDGEQKEDDGQGDEENDQKDGENENPEGNPNPPEEEKKNDQKQDQKQQQPQPGQLSPQQIKNLLDAMNNEEKKVQDKINAKKQKGAKIKSNKDW